MSYYSPIGGTAGYGGLGYHSLGADFPIREPAPGMRALQQQLQRLGYLQAGTGVFGADAEFGPRTATALRGAAGYVNWTGSPYTPTNADAMRSGTVVVPDDLIRRIEAARPDPAAPHASETIPEEGGLVEPGTIGPHLDVSTESTGGDEMSWLPYVLVGGGVLLVGGVIVWTTSKKKPRKTVTANRRRRRR